MEKAPYGKAYSFYYKNKIYSLSENKIKDINNSYNDNSNIYNTDSKNLNQNYNTSKAVKTEEFNINNNNMKKEKSQTCYNNF